MAEKKRDTIHISYNDKEYYDDVKEVIEAWEKSGKVRSKEVCKCILTVSKVNKSMTLNKLFSTFKMIEDTLAPGFKDKNDPVYKELVEKICSEVIDINPSKLAMFITNPFGKVEELKNAQSIVSNSQNKVIPTEKEEVALTLEKEDNMVAPANVKEIKTIEDTMEKSVENSDKNEENSNNNVNKDEEIDMSFAN